MAVRAIVLDIGGVLELTPSTGRVDKWEARLGLKPGELRARVDAVVQPGCVGEASYETIQARVAETLLLGADASREYWADVWDEYLGTLNEQLVTYVASLRPTYRVAMLSNSFVGAREREEAAYAFSRIGEFIMYSHEEGLQKPAPAFYLLACQRLDVAPHEVVFVDDKQVCVDAARALGMQAVRFSDTAQAIAEIERCLAATNDPSAPTG